MGIESVSRSQSKISFIVTTLRQKNKTKTNINEQILTQWCSRQLHSRLESWVRVSLPQFTLTWSFCTSFRELIFKNEEKGHSNGTSRLN